MILFRRDHLVCNSMPYGLALHCWLFAPNSVTRKRADAIRLTTQAYDSHGLGFNEYGFDAYVKGVKSDCIVAQAIKIINCSDDLEDVRFAALQFAVRSSEISCHLTAPVCG
jgi:hypothetical protein